MAEMTPRASIWSNSVCTCLGRGMSTRLGANRETGLEFLFILISYRVHPDFLDLETVQGILPRSCP